MDAALGLYRAAGASPRIAEVWGAEREGDFMCGYFVGEMVGAASAAFRAARRRDPGAAEQAEIVGIVEARAADIRAAFSRLNGPARKG